MQVNPETLKANLSAVKQRISAAAERFSMPVPELLAVSKKKSVTHIQTLLELGQVAFGESYVQEAVDKMRFFSAQKIIWHFIGPIQSNKTRAIAENFDWVQSVDRQKIAVRLDQQRPSDMQPLNVLVQLKIGEEETKSGVNKSEILHLMQTIKACDRLQLRGLMCIPPPSSNEIMQKQYFDQARSVFERHQERFQLDTLSMGMSADLEMAVAAATTMVRVGTDIFGKR